MAAPDLDAPTLLALDVGNSQVKLALFSGDRLVAEARLSSRVERNDDGWRDALSTAVEPLRLRDIGRVALASVVPTITVVLERLLTRLTGQPPLIVSAGLDLGLRIEVAEPERVGADRLCAAVAGYTHFARPLGRPLIAICAGTATTYEVVTTDGAYLGGAIAPGIETTATALVGRTALLPAVDLYNVPDRPIGRTTDEAMRAGLLFGAIDSTAGMIERLKRELIRRGESAAPPVVVATGGFGALMGTHLGDRIDHVEPRLIVDGLRLLADRLLPTEGFR